MPNRVLIISPSPDLRKSLAFALETEGYVVTSYAGIPGGDAGRSYDCVVMDHKAARASREAVVQFCAKTPNLVYLDGTPQPWLTGWLTHIVPTPLAGNTLVEAVRDVCEHPTVIH